MSGGWSQLLAGMVGGVLALAGVLLNGLLTRWRDDRQFRREVASRFDERRFETYVEFISLIDEADWEGLNSDALAEIHLKAVRAHTKILFLSRDAGVRKAASRTVDVIAKLRRAAEADKPSERWQELWRLGLTSANIEFNKAAAAELGWSVDDPDED